LFENDIVTLNEEGMRILLNEELTLKANILLKLINIYRARIIKIENDGYARVTILGDNYPKDMFEENNFGVPMSILKVVEVDDGFAEKSFYLRRNLR
jgi:hypothetical protein